jgi:hypothetical protein
MRRGMRRTAAAALGTAALAALASVAGCDPSRVAGSGSGRLIVVTATSGADRDVGGYTLEIAPVPGRRGIGDNDTLTIDALPAGTYVVTLTEVAARCAVAGERVREATVAAGVDAVIAYAISCPAAVVAIDAGHHNHHTAEGSYAPLAALLRAAGFTVESVSGTFDPASLQGVTVLIVANALHEQNMDNWALPTPSAFTDGEVAALVEWVNGGGGLLLIADHMPFPGAAAELAAAFGVVMSNGFAWDTARSALPKPCLSASEIDIFSRAAGSLAAHPITAGRSAAERVDSVATFTGHAFTTSGGHALLTLGSGWRSLLPQRAWAFTEVTPRADHSGWQQGAVLWWGAGRVAIFGEAGMFTEQTCGAGLPMGMNAPQAAQNPQFALNVLYWLAGYLERE